MTRIHRWATNCAFPALTLSGMLYAADASKKTLGSELRRTQIEYVQKAWADAKPGAQAESARKDSRDSMKNWRKKTLESLSADQLAIIVDTTKVAEIIDKIIACRAKREKNTTDAEINKWWKLQTDALEWRSEKECRSEEAK